MRQPNHGYSPETADIKRRVLSVPEDVFYSAKLHSKMAFIAMSTFTMRSHSLLQTVSQIGVDKDTTVRGRHTEYPLPRLAIPTDAQTTKNQLILQHTPERLITESDEYRQRHDITLSQYATRSLRLMNYMFEIMASDHILISEKNGNQHILIYDMSIPS